MAEVKNKIQYIVCPVCSGAGKNKLGLSCLNCASLGIHGRFFYWGPKLGRAMIELRQIREKFNFIINTLAYAAGLIGLGALGYWLFLTSQTASLIDDFAFWQSG